MLYSGFNILPRSVVRRQTGFAARITRTLSTSEKCSNICGSLTNCSNRLRLTALFGDLDEYWQNKTNEISQKMPRTKNGKSFPNCMASSIRYFIGSVRLLASLDRSVPCSTQVGVCNLRIRRIWNALFRNCVARILSTRSGSNRLGFDCHFGHHSVCDSVATNVSNIGHQKCLPCLCYSDRSCRLARVQCGYKFCWRIDVDAPLKLRRLRFAKKERWDNNVLIRSGEALGIGWSRNMLYSGFNTLHRSVVRRQTGFAARITRTLYGSN